jgi:AAA family ATP:ADP antiporter
MHGSAVASAVAHFLARPGPTQNLEAVRVLLQAATTSEGADSHKARLEAARLIGSLPDQFEEQLNALLKDRSSDVARLALRAAAVVGKATSVPLVVARLADPDLAADAADTLVLVGDRALPALRQALSDNASAITVRHGIPDVLQRIATPEAEQLLIEHILDGDPLFRLRSVSALNKLRQQNGDRRLEQELLETMLSAEILGHYRSYQLLGRLSPRDAASAPVRARVKASMDHELERIFRLMKLLLPQHDLHSAYVGLQSGNAVVHANSLEFLEHALPAPLRAMLLPLIDSEVSVEARVAMADRVVGKTKETPEQALAAFEASNQPGV